MQHSFVLHSLHCESYPPLAWRVSTGQLFETFHPWTFTPPLVCAHTCAPWTSGGWVLIGGRWKRDLHNFHIMTFGNTCQGKYAKFYKQHMNYLLTPKVSHMHTEPVWKAKTILVIMSFFHFFSHEWSLIPCFPYVEAHAFMDFIVVPIFLSPQHSWWGLVLVETHPAQWVTLPCLFYI